MKKYNLPTAATAATNEPETKKFWCHYIGRDGNTPRRRSIELKRLTIQGATLWGEYEEDRYNPRYELYYQLNDKIAVSCNWSLRVTDWNEMIMTDEQVNEEAQRRKADNPTRWTDKDIEGYISRYIESRDYKVSQYKKLADFTSYLLNEAHWVTRAQLAAYKEAEHPQYEALLAVRKAGEELRAERDRQRKEEERKRQEEAERKRKEEEQKEQERLAEQESKFKNGERISGEDVVTLCRKYGINMHLRTIHNLQQVICDISGKYRECRFYRTAGKRRPQLDGCYNVAEELYKYLNK